MLLEGSQLGNYRLTHQIGSGGMGEIYLAEDSRIARQVAVKVVRNEPVSYPDAASIQESARLFQREMKAVASLDNPHILTLLDFGEETINGTIITYMVMPYRQEGSLNDWVSRRTEKLSFEEINSIIQQAADALQYAHDNGIIHQDVKPSNFLIRSRRGQLNQPDLLLADFGIAKILGATSTASQTSRGTAAFMPPEQWDGQPVAATDQYALAIMAYLLLTGRTPFQGRLEQVMRQHFMTEPAPPSTFNPVISTDVDKVILHALAKKPEERFASVSNFANALEQALLSSKATSPLQKALEPTIYVSFDPLVPPVANASAPTVLATSNILKPLDTIANKGKDTPSLSRPLPPHSQHSQTRTVIAVLVLLIVISSAIGFGTYTSNVSQSNARATASANDAATSQAQDRANIAATATVVAANPYPSYLAGQRGKLAFYDSFAQSSGAWGGYTTSGCVGYLTGGAYHVSAEISYFSACYASQSSQRAILKNFAFEVQMTVINGNCGGLIFRANGNELYYYEICADGTYTLRRYTSNNSATSILSAFSSSINPGLGKSNTIAVVANGSLITLYVNTTQINHITDSSYLEGAIAIFASAVSSTTEVSFSNARVWTL